MSFPKIQHISATKLQDTLMIQGGIAAPKGAWLRERIDHFSGLKFVYHKFLYLRGKISQWLSEILGHLHIKSYHYFNRHIATATASSQHISHSSTAFRSSQSLDTSVSGVFVSGKIAQPDIKLRTRKEFIDELIADKTKFNEFVYTDLKNAVCQLKEREGSKKLNEYIQKQLPEGLPRNMIGFKSMVLGRAIATPNYEMHRFMALSETLPKLRPLILEYTEDKFCDANSFKRSLCKLQICNGFDKNNNPIITYKSIADITDLNGKNLNSISHCSGEPVIDFHHRKFLKKFPRMKNNLFDVSTWSAVKNKAAREWYKKYLILFLKDAILFENYITVKHEIDITQKLALPLIAEIESECGFKPLIVSLEPSKSEGQRFWESYPSDISM